MAVLRTGRESTNRKYIGSIELYKCWVLSSILKETIAKMH